MKRITLLLLMLFVSVPVLRAQSWAEASKVSAPDKAEKDYFGNPVSISGNYALVGVPQKDRDAYGLNPKGAAYLFKNEHGTWIFLKKLVPSERTADADFGGSVSISGDFALIGAAGEDVNDKNDAGAAYIFYKNQGGTDNWGEVTKLVSPHLEAGGWFGNAVSICGDNALVGASRESYDSAGGDYKSAAGAAYIFKKKQDGVNHWGLTDILIAGDRTSWDNFGSSVAMSGNLAIVGTPNENEEAPNGGGSLQYAGSAYIFYADSSGHWTRIKKIIASDRASNDNFGRTVAISPEGYAFVYALNKQVTWPDAGAVYIYKKDQGGKDNWGELKRLTAPHPAEADRFGAGIAVSGNNLLVGIPGDAEDENEQNPKTAAGAVYFFSKDEGGTDNWGRVTKWVASDREADDHFGNALAFSGHYAIVGATGKGGIIDDNGAEKVGAAYFFTDYPVIASNPADQMNVCPNSQVTFRIVTKNTKTYQWQVSSDKGASFSDLSNSNLYHGVTTDSFQVSNVSLNINGFQYRCKIGNSLGNIFSLPAILSTDTVLPVVTCVDNQERVAGAEHYYTVQGTEFDPVKTEDNCGVDSVVNNFNDSSTLAGAKLPEGTTTIAWTVTDKAGNKATAKFDVTVKAYNDIPSLEKYHISIHPNPASGKVNLNFGNVTVNQVILSDLAGKVFLRKKVTTQSLTLDLSGFAKGVYLLRLVTDKGELSGKIIKR